MPSIRSNWELHTIQDTYITDQKYQSVINPEDLTTIYAENNFNRLFFDPNRDRNVSPRELDHVCAAIKVKVAIKQELQMQGISYDDYRLSAGDRPCSHESDCVSDTSTVYLNEGDFLDLSSELANELRWEGIYHDYDSVTFDQFEACLVNAANNGGDPRLTYSQLNSA